MRQENRELLEDVINDRLNKALDGENEDERSVAFKNAMEAISRSTDLSKQDDAFQEHEEKLAHEKEKLEQEKEKLAQDRAFQEQQLAEARKEKKRSFWISVGGVVLTAIGSIVVPVLLDKKNREFKTDFAHECMEFESNGGMFTTTAGKSTKDYLRHK